MDSGYVRHGPCDIYYESHGSGSSILFIHAGVTDSRMWRDQLHMDGYRSVVFDQRGYGKTEWAPGPYSNREDALAVLDHIEIDSAVVVGCSNGGEAAMQLALIAPDRVDGLVLVGSAPRGWEPDGGWNDDPLWDEAVKAFEAGDIEAVVELDARMWLAGQGRSLDDIDPNLIELFFDMDRTPAATESERNEYVQTLDPPTNERLEEIAVPALVVVGDRDDPDLVAAAHYLAGQMSERDAVIITGAAHLPSLEKPEAFNAALRSFLSTI
ncbi:MAG TPA: alpha/beta hydrolase [Acidimicrobiia bacterium]